MSALKAIDYALYIHGGIYIGSQTIITKWPKEFWYIDYKSQLQDVVHGYKFASIQFFLKTDSQIFISNYRQNKSDNCQDFVKIKQNLDNISVFNCLSFKQFHNVYYPKDIWNQKEAVFRILNYIMYGQRQTPHPVTSAPRIPNIAHMLIVGGHPLPFLAYLSLLSLKYIVKVESVYVYGDAPPTGQLWDDLIKKHKGFEFIAIERPTSIYGQKVIHVHAMSDIFRTVILLKYGGIYSDMDVIWTRQIPEELWYYEAVGSYDWAHNYQPFPEYINLGVAMGKAGAKFWALMLESMKDFRDNVFGYNGLLVPYKIYERHPNTLYLDKHLQVMCFRNECYPLWGKQWAEVNWKTETSAVHWTHPDPKELTSRDALMSANRTTFATIGRFVLQQAGEL